MRRAVLAVAAIVLTGACSDASFHEGRYLFDGSPPVHRDDIVSVALDAIPEGAGAPLFVMDPESEPSGQREEDLAEILRFMPDPLPATLDQGDCDFGGDVVVTTSEGNTIAYGPCRRPRSIERLRAHMVAIINESE